MGEPGSCERVCAYRIERRADAPVETVFDLLADGAGWSTWTRIGETTLESTGRPPPDGVGAVRLFRTGPVRSREEVTEFEPPAGGSARFGYRLLSGLPVRDYRAEVDLEGDGDGTAVTWTASFVPGPPGTRRLMAAFLRRTVGEIADGLVREAERRTRS